MGYETRKGRTYYYHKRRTGGRVVSVYCGSGGFAEGLAAGSRLCDARDAAARGGRPDVLTADALKMKYLALKAELAGPAPAPVVRLLAERVAVCWLQAYRMDVRWSLMHDRSMAVRECVDRMRDRAGRRYVAALK